MNIAVNVQFFRKLKEICIVATLLRLVGCECVGTHE